MNLSCGSRTIKYLIFTFNFFLVITGIVLISVGASIRAIYSDYHLFLSGSYFSLPNLLIATGCLIFCISFLGCYGAMKQSWVMLMGFSILLGIIFIFEFAAGIAGYVLRDQTSNYLENTMKENMKLYHNDSSISDIWDTIQKEFQCCGVINYTDWIVENKKPDLPISCCPAKSGTMGGFYCNDVSSIVITTTPAPTTAPSSTTKSVSLQSRKKRAANDAPVGSKTTPIPSSITPVGNETTPIPSSTTTPYGIGCEAAFGDFVRAHAVDIGGIGFALAVIQIIGILFSCHLSRQLKNSYYST
ncbi:CD63 antigen isoform X3 [Leptinotarsa decemlineata]|uniref:CD63 antigen isoform X3 n=1 Tax=Leptinotarsa decemlineata TaxID=7539 RepID=UPI003D30D2B3